MTTWCSILFLGAGEWSSLITLVVLAIFSGISSFLQRRAAQREEEQSRGLPPAPPPRRAPVPTQESEVDWESELRRLLGQPPVRESSPRETPPPPPLPSLPPPPSRPVRTVPPIRPVVETEEGPALNLPPLVESKSVLQQASDLNEQVVERLHRVSGGLGRMSESSAALGHIAQFDQGVQRHLEEGIARSRQAASSRSDRGLSPQAKAVRGLLRSPEGARQAVLASLVLGPPKGLEFP